MHWGVVHEGGYFIVWAGGGAVGRRGGTVRGGGGAIGGGCGTVWGRGGPHLIISMVVLCLKGFRFRI